MRWKKLNHLIKIKEKKIILNNKTLLIVLGVFLLTLAVRPVFSSETKIILSPINPQFQKYMDLTQSKKVSEMLTTEGQALGLVPSPLDMNHTKGLSIVPEIERLFYPSSYDLRELDRLTPVKNQGQCGSCWAFASYGSLESWLLGEEDEIWDFSENNLKDCHGFDSGGCDGGNRWMSTAYLARWDGPINEADDPYKPTEENCIPGLPVVKHLETVLMIPEREDFTDNDNIKQVVIDYGAMYTAMHMNPTYYNSNYHAYYYNGLSSSNHAVAIVGWEDDFDKDKFNTIPPDNGAWIVRNSWGTGWGDEGYFYVSYYDRNIGKENVSFINAKKPYDNFSIYQYDSLGCVRNFGYSANSAWGANIFTATSGQKLIAVSFYALTVDTSYEIYIYDIFEGSSFSDLLANKTGTVTSPGYHTIYLDSSVILTSKDDFIVAVKLTTPEYNYPIPIEYPELGYSSAAKANPGESYISSDGANWTDITTVIDPEFPNLNNTNVCIKAMTQDVITYPNPFKPLEHNEMIFGGFDGTAHIRIFTLSGELVREVDVTGEIQWIWNGKNDTGENVARGIYLYIVTTPSGYKKIGKIAIIK